MTKQFKILIADSKTGLKGLPWIKNFDKSVKELFKFNDV